MKVIPGCIAIVQVSLLLGAALVAQEPTAPAPEGAGPDATAGRAAPVSAEPRAASDVRIVRLSLVNGAVQLDRNTDRGFEAAFANLPVVQGERLKALEGVAEVEFEDNSTLRITPNTRIDFPSLGRGQTGGTRSGVRVEEGTLYVSLEKSKGNEFTVSFGDRTIDLPPGSHIRLDVGASGSKLVVFSGKVTVRDASGETIVGKKKALLFEGAAPAPTLVASRDEDSPFDAWDKTQADYHKLRSVSAYGSSSASYGLSDLNYYGGFVNGCGGTMWRPYLASAAWDPYSNGIWAWYPGSGYSWVSPYPWGWTPFHSGSWDYCPAGGGWGWRPGGAWRGLSNRPTPIPTNLAKGPVHSPAVPRPPNPPMPGHATVQVVSTRPLAVSRQASSESFVFRNDSAGLGVPRGSLGRLNKISAEAVQHGSASMPIVSYSPVREEHGQNVHAAGSANSNARTNDASAGRSRAIEGPQQANRGERGAGGWTGSGHSAAQTSAGRGDSAGAYTSPTPRAAPSFSAPAAGGGSMGGGSMGSRSMPPAQAAPSAPAASSQGAGAGSHH